jgi:hypothetical protein
VASGRNDLIHAAFAVAIDRLRDLIANRVKDVARMEVEIIFPVIEHSIGQTTQRIITLRLRRRRALECSVTIGIKTEGCSQPDAASISANGLIEHSDDVVVRQVIHVDGPAVGLVMGERIESTEIVVNVVTEDVVGSQLGKCR